MKVKTGKPISFGDELHIDKLSTKPKTIQIRIGPETGNYAKGSRTAWLTYRQARTFAYELLAHVERSAESD